MLVALFLAISLVRALLRPNYCVRHDGPAYAVAFSDDGVLVATGGLDGKIHVVRTGGEGPILRSAQYDSAVLKIAFRKPEELVALFDEEVRVVSVRSGTLETRSVLHPEFPAMGFKLDETTESIRIPSRDGRTFVWNPCDGNVTEDKETRFRHDGLVSPSGKRTLRSDDMTEVEILATNDGSVIRRFRLPEPANCFSWSHDDTLVACGHGSRDHPGAKGSISVLSVLTEAEATVYRTASAVSDVEFCPTDLRLAYAEYSGGVTIRRVSP
jgi:WD40 repeat protein